MTYINLIQQSNGGGTRLILDLRISDIDDAKILSGDGVTKAFEQSREKIIKIRQEALLLIGFKSRAKEPPNLNATIKLISILNW